MVGPKANVWYPYTKRRGPRRVGHMKREAEIGGGGISISQGMPRIVRSYQKLGERHGTESLSLCKQACYLDF